MQLPAPIKREASASGAPTRFIADAVTVAAHA
ncbi:hypothetical protein J2X49_000147 [Agrococcus sp. BE272]|nr:hypothetical protein [Agrococcus sp. BE272]